MYVGAKGGIDGMSRHGVFLFSRRGGEMRVFFEGEILDFSDQLEHGRQSKRVAFEPGSQ